MNYRSVVAILVSSALLLPLAAMWWPRAQSELGFAAAGEFGWQPFVASLIVAASAAALATLIGGAMAVLFSLTDLPGSTLWATLAILAFACPATVWALAQVYCYGPGGLVERWLGEVWRMAIGFNRGHYLSTVLVLAEIHAPLACLVIGRGAERLHHAGLEAATFYLRRWQLVRWLIGSLRSEVTASLLLTFALCAGNFAVPHVLQCRLYPIEIYQRMTNYLDQTGAAWAAAPLLATTLLAAGFVAVFERGASRGRATMHASAGITLGRGKWLALGLVLAYLGATTALPLSALLYECKSLSNFLAATRDAGPEIDNMLWIASAAAGVACLAGLLTTLASFQRGHFVAEVLSILPIGVPTLLIGLAYASFFSRRWPLDLSWVGDTSWLVILGLGFRGWPFAARLLIVGRRQLSPEWNEAVGLSGISSARRWRWITGPLIWNHAAAGAIVAFVLAAGDVEISQMLCAPGGGTLALRLFTFLHFGPTHVAASLALLLLLITSLPVWIYYLILKRQLAVV